MLLVTFGDQDTRTSEVRIIKEGGDLDLGRLDRIQAGRFKTNQKIHFY